MKTKTSLLIVGLLAASLGTGFAVAERGKDGDCEGRWNKHERHHKFSGSHMRHGKMLQREFSADEIRTLAEARLLMQDNENLKIGNIKTTETGYIVAIVTKDGSLVEEREVAKNGMPVEMYERMKQRLEERRTKSES